MTPGEIKMASRLFGESIDYARVEVHARRYLPFGLQPKNCAIGNEHARHCFMHQTVRKR
ncbi:hypothetical protein [Massilia sp. CCM 8734]|uniref:hypothetical protein n=1 Tax=Massilia sp. CCM 8734 TaxID=2609283 RepID=UPI00141DF11E|nr:hypothetical protein [Massilia sp. CCM 8734]